MELDIAGQAIIKNLNIRAEHHGDERELGCDLKLLLHSNLDALANFSPTLKAFLYDNADDDERRTLRMPQLKPLGMTLEYEHHVLCIADQTWDDVKLHKFELTPESNGNVEIQFTASMSKVDPAILPVIAALWLEEAVNVDIEAMQGELFAEEAA